MFIGVLMFHDLTGLWPLVGSRIIAMHGSCMFHGFMRVASVLVLPYHGLVSCCDTASMVLKCGSNIFDHVFLQGHGWSRVGHGFEKN